MGLQFKTIVVVYNRECILKEISFGIIKENRLW